MKTISRSFTFNFDTDCEWYLYAYMWSNTLVSHTYVCALIHIIRVCTVHPAPVYWWLLMEKWVCVFPLYNAHIACMCAIANTASISIPSQSQAEIHIKYRPFHIILIPAERVESNEWFDIFFSHTVMDMNFCLTFYSENRAIQGKSPAQICNVMLSNQSMWEFYYFPGIFSRELNDSYKVTMICLEETKRNCIHINISLVAWVHWSIAWKKSNFVQDAVAFNWQKI